MLDERVTGLEARLDELAMGCGDAEHTTILNQHTDMLGKLIVGVHDIQLSIKHLIDRHGNGSGAGD